MLNKTITLLYCYNTAYTEENIIRDTKSEKYPVWHSRDYLWKKNHVCIDCTHECWHKPRVLYIFSFFFFIRVFDIRAFTRHWCTPCAYVQVKPIINRICRRIDIKFLYNSCSRNYPQRRMHTVSWFCVYMLYYIRRTVLGDVVAGFMCSTSFTQSFHHSSFHATDISRLTNPPARRHVNVFSPVVT